MSGSARSRSAASLHRRGAALLALCGAAASAQALTAAELYAQLSPSVWVVRTFDKDTLPLGLGSAVVVAPQSLVTNCHVLRRAKRMEVTHEKTTWPATLELWDVARDLCQLKAPGVTAPAVPLGDAATLAVGQPVYALGSPAGMELSLSAGLLSGLRRNDAQRLVAIQTSASISQGSSGGGLFDDQGRLIGITTAFVGGNAQNLNLAVPVDMVRELPQRHAAAQQAKLNPAPPAVAKAEAAAAPAASGVPPAAPAAVAPALPGTLQGRWSGQYRCGPYMGAGPVERPAPWDAAVVMTVGNAVASIVRTDPAYAETVSGAVRADLSATLEGRGAYRGQPDGAWQTRVTGRFVGTGKDLRFGGRAEIRSAAGEVVRDCLVVLGKDPDKP